MALTAAYTLGNRTRYSRKLCLNTSSEGLAPEAAAAPVASIGTNHRLTDRLSRWSPRETNRPHIYPSITCFVYVVQSFLRTALLGPDLEGQPF